jgi:O-antigen biosynthesis protein
MITSPLTTGNKNLLVIAPAVPRPDMNSGDLRLFSLLEILAKKYNTTFVSTSFRQGEGHYVSRLEHAGITVLSEDFSLTKLLKSSKFDLAILEFYFIADHYLDRIRLLQPECRVVVDSVDVHFLRLLLKFEVTKDDVDKKTYYETKSKEIAIYRKADAVITVTDDDAAALLDECPSITCEVVPNIHEICLNSTPPERNTLVFVGGFTHKPNLDAVIYFCDEILPLIWKEQPAIKLAIIGSNPPEQILNFANNKIHVTGYVPEITPYLHNSHISIAPLRFGAGMKGKIGEAMAHGVPVVTTTVGSQGMGLTDRKDVMIADTPQQFAEAVLEIINDDGLYETIRKNAVKIIEDNYTPSRVGQLMFNSLERVCVRPVKKMTFQEKIGFVSKYVVRRIRF